MSLNLEIWVELDEYDTELEKPSDDDEFCNAIIYLTDGKQIGLNVWSEQYFYSQIKNLDWLDGQVAILPDIVVRNFNSLSIKIAITKLVTECQWLEGRELPIEEANKVMKIGLISSSMRESKPKSIA